MHMKKLFRSSCAAAIALGFGLAATADTLYLKNGARVNGQVVKNEDGSYGFNVEGRKMMYRASEVISHEKNSLTGSEYRERAQQRKAAREKEALEKSGLTAEQRAEVMRIIRKFRSNDVRVVQKHEKELIAYGKDVNILRFLESVLPSLTQSTYPPTLSVYTVLASKSASARALLAAAEHPAAKIRERSIVLMADMNDTKLTKTIVRGLVDPDSKVQLAAINTLGKLRVQAASPALIELLDQKWLRAGNFIQQSLERMWVESNQVPSTGEAGDWKTFWEKHKADVARPVRLSDLTPLIDTDEEFVAG
jgi:hypothetical protein